MPIIVIVILIYHCHKTTDLIHFTNYYSNISGIREDSDNYPQHISLHGGIVAAPKHGGLHLHGGRRINILHF
jgi:hypothetical protein